MPDESSRPPDQQQPVERGTDFPRESRYEFVAILAYKLWEKRGRPFGSPDVDWFAAERAVYAALLASGMITPSPNDLRDILSPPPLLARLDHFVQVGNRPYLNRP